MGQDGVRGENLAGQYFVSTGSGKYMRNVLEDPYANIGIVEINETGDAFRIVWGLANGARPTSEFESHYMNHCVAAARTDGADRVIYHAHTPGIIEMSFVVPLEDRAFTRILWQMMTECVVVFPTGVGVVPWMVPGGPATAEASSELMKTYDTIVWAHHGLFAAGPDLTRPLAWRTPSRRPPRSTWPRVLPTVVRMTSSTRLATRASRTPAATSVSRSTRHLLTSK